MAYNLATMKEFRLQEISNSSNLVPQSGSNTFRICVFTKERRKLIGVDEKDAVEIESRTRKIMVSIMKISARQGGLEFIKEKFQKYTCLHRRRFLSL